MLHRLALAGALALCFSGTASAEQVKRLWLHNVHTGAKGVEIFWRESTGYDEAALARLDWFFRDHRRNKAVEMDRKLYEMLYSVQYAAKFSAPITVLSGHRTRETNDALRAAGRGAARESKHILGQAADIRISGVPTARLAKWLRDLGAGGVGEYGPRSGDFVHVDVAKPRFWWK